MRRSLIALTVAALVATGLGAPASLAEPTHSRVIVSVTLNSTLQFFDAVTLAETQPPLPSRGAGPVRMAIANTVWPQLFVANHGVEGSVGWFDLSGDTVIEEPLSPVPARAGSVGIDTADVAIPGTDEHGSMVFVTNTWQALGGCGLPKGSVTGFERYLISVPDAPHGFISNVREAGTVDVSGAIPYGVGIDGETGRAFASSNCSATLDTIDIQSNGGFSTAHPAMTITKGVTRPTGASPDAVVVDPSSGLVYVTNIGGSSVTVFGPDSPGALTTVPLPATGPIDAALADSASGRRWLVTSNGRNDTISLVDRAIVASCISAAVASCPQAEVARIATAVPGGAPEGIAYDPATNRVFVVNKTIGAPTLSVIQLDESGPQITGTDIARIPISVAGAGTPGAAIAFDVVVQQR